MAAYGLLLLCFTWRSPLPVTQSAGIGTFAPPMLHAALAIPAMTNIDVFRCQMPAPMLSPHSTLMAKGWLQYSPMLTRASRPTQQEKPQ